MAIPARLPSPVEGVRDHHFHPLRVRRVVRETPDAATFVFEVPEDGPAFDYEAGQFCTFRVPVDGESLLRCYSMSSTPGVDDELAVTVKRVPDGRVSNWLNDHLAEGDEIDATLPAGVFCLDPGGGDLVAFAGGSGVTPVFSLVKAALATTRRRVHLLYANRDREHTIFAAALDELAQQHPGRLDVVHHLDVEHGFVDREVVAPYASRGDDPDFYLCGPTPFMDLVEDALVGEGIHPGRIRVERFSTPEPLEVVPTDAPAEGEATMVTIELGRQTGTTPHHPGTTILQTARQLGLPAPSSCEAGSCATCMAQVVEGSVTMRVNNALTEDEVAEGWVLTCQSVPTGPSVRVVYEGN
jgi:ferredoxin-NADP reductase